MREARRSGFRLSAAAGGLAALAVLLVAPRPGGCAEVNGIWTEPATKDLGELTGYEFLKGWKIRGWEEAYYVYNFNDPSQDTVNDNEGSSVIKGGDLTIEGRTFDVHSNQPTHTMIEMELEKVPQLGEGWLDPKAFGFKVDANYGDAYNIIYDTIQAGGDVDEPADRYLSHYSIGYVAPVGRGLRVDLGKFVTHIGGETIESIKNNNFSHGYLYSYAIPFWDFGARISYPWTDTLSTEFYVLQGWNVTWDDKNGGKTVGPSIIWAPSPRVSAYANYLIGPEQRNSDSNMRQLLDLGLALNPVDPLNVLISFDYGHEKDAIGQKNVNWYGGFGVFRYRLTDHFEPAVRLEYYDDPDGFTTGVDHGVFEATLTLNYRFDLPYGVHLLVRPEYRWDHSNEDFYSKSSTFRARQNQHTLGLGVVLYY